MNNALKTSIAAAVALAISFALLFAYLDLFGTLNQTNASTEKLDTSSFNGEKRILLLGSSYVDRLNATYIKQYLSENGLQQFKVYNIAKNGAGNPSQQIEFLDSITAAHPTVVVYGLGFRELGYKPYINDIPKCALVDESSKGIGQTFSTPSADDAASYIQKITNLKTDYFSNIPDPNHVTVNVLRSLFESSNSSKSNSTSQVNESLFDNRGPTANQIQSIVEINKPLDYVVRICPEDLDNELATLGTIVSKFKQDNIKVVLFVPPFAHSYLNAVGDKGIQVFLSHLNKFAKDNNLNLYDLHDKYADLEIWADPQHVAKNPGAIIYSDDLAKIILEESKSFAQLRIVDISDENLSYQDLSNADLRNADLSNKNLTGAILVNSNLFGANVNGTIFTKANLNYAYLHNLDLSGKDFSGTTITGADLTDAKLDGVSLSGKDLSETNLSGVDLSGKDLTGTNLAGTILVKANLSGVSLSGKDLTGTNLSFVDLSGKDLTGTNLAGTILIQAKLDGVDLSGKDLSGTNLKDVNLIHTNLTGTNLVGSTLIHAYMGGMDLSGKNLTGTFLDRANFYHANLSGVDFTGTDMKRAILIGANLSNAILVNVDLSSNNLTGTILIGANLGGATIKDVNLAGKDLTGVNLAQANLARTNLSWIDFRGKNLAGTNLVEDNLDHANLSGVNLSKKNLSGISMQEANLKGAVLYQTKLINANLYGSDLSGDDLHNTILQNVNLTNANLSGTNLSGNDLTNATFVGANLAGANLVNTNTNGLDLHSVAAMTKPVEDKFSAETNSSQEIKIISDFQTDKDWTIQSHTGSQSYDQSDFINGTQSLKLETIGNGSATFSRSQIFSSPVDLNNKLVNAWIKIDDASKVKELWFFFTTDNFKSSWYTYKVPMSKEIKSGQWFMVSFNLENSTSIGVPDISSIDRIQVRITDDSTGPIILHVNEISVQDKTSK